MTIVQKKNISLYEAGREGGRERERGTERRIKRRRENENLETTMYVPRFCLQFQHFSIR